jgi:hypothetical protein
MLYQIFNSKVHQHHQLHLLWMVAKALSSIILFNQALGSQPLGRLKGVEGELVSKTTLPTQFS